MKKLPKVFKEKWLKALRSCKYKQGTNGLRSADNRFCCLGVACDIYRPKTWIENENECCFMTSNLTSYYPDDWDLPKKVGDVLSQEYNGEVIGHALAKMNDSGMKFYQIARWIERHL